MEGMADSDLVPGIGAFVAIGDSFTEGLNDPDPREGLHRSTARRKPIRSERCSGPASNSCS